MKRYSPIFLFVLSPILLGTLLTADMTQAAVSFLEDFEGDPLFVGSEIEVFGWQNGGQSVGFGPGNFLPGNVAYAPASNQSPTLTVGPEMVDDLMVITADMYVTGIYDTNGGDGGFGIDDGNATYVNTLYIGPHANPANPGYPGAGGGGWVLWEGLDTNTRMNITDGGAPGVGNRFVGIGSGYLQVQLTINQIANTISVDISELESGATVNPTWTMPLTAAAKTKLANVNSIGLAWNDFHRGDMAEIDNISVNSGLVGTPNQWTWNQDGFGDWNRQEYWTPDSISGIGSVPVSAEHTAVFGDNVASATLVGVNSPVTVNRIEFDSANTYMIAGANTVSLEATTSAENPSIAVHRGDHQFQAEFILNDDATLDIAAGSSLTFNNILDLGGNGLAKTGTGTLLINNILSSGNGGTLHCQEGTCGGAGTIAGNVVNNGGTLSPGSSSSLSAASAVVPEPAGLLLSLFGALAVTFCRYRRPA